MNEYNLKSIKQDFKNKGIFYTPPELALKLKSYLDFEPKEVYDPTCGDGALLATFDDSVKKFGQEINPDQLEVAKSNLTNFTGVCDDTLTNPAFLDRKFDCILANPPFSIEWQQKSDVRFEKTELAPKSKADYAFILHILYLLSETGTAVILNFPGILYRSGREGKIRQWLVEQNVIDTIELIPGKTFVDTTIGTVVLVLKKNRTKPTIKFIDGENSLTRDVTLEEIKQNDFTLSVSTYLQKEIIKEVINPLDLELKARSQFLRKLEADLNFSKMVCELEGYDFSFYITALKNVIKKFSFKTTNSNEFKAQTQLI